MFLSTFDLVYDEVLQVVFKIKVASYVSGIDSFSFDIIMHACKAAELLGRTEEACRQKLYGLGLSMLQSDG